MFEGLSGCMIEIEIYNSEITSNPLKLPQKAYSKEQAHAS
jgi:hypothetical protein